MKALLFLTLLISISLSPAEDASSTLIFADKTTITGKVSQIRPNQELLTLTSPTLQGNAQLDTSQLLEISLGQKPPKISSDHYALATIKEHFNDPHRDTIRGRLTHLDPDTITLDTWYAGPLTLKRSLVHALDIFTDSPTFYSGPNGPDGWITSRGTLEENWTFKNRSMISKNRHGAARKIKIPERATISLTASWKSAPYFRVLFLSANQKAEYPATGYALNIQQNRLTLQRNTPQQGNNNILNEVIGDLSELEQGTLTIYLDRKKTGQSAVYLDGRQIGTWTDVDDTTFQGDWFHLIPNRNTPLKISKLSISQWDGVLPASPDDPSLKGTQAGQLKVQDQHLHLNNGDTVIGTISKIEKELVHLRTDFGNVKVPLRHMKSINLSHTKDQDRRERNDVRAWFHEGGYVTIKVKSFDGKTIKGYSQVYGDAEFNITAFSRIQFNIWKHNLDAARLIRDTEDW